MQIPEQKQKTMIVLLLLLSLLFSPTLASDQSNGTTVYELLPKFGLPSGLLPDSVQSFSISDNGSFWVKLQSPCYIEFDYLTSYDSLISGVIRYGGIDHLKGIKVRKLLIWFDVESIKVDLPPSDYIYFEVGWIIKKLKIEQFKTVHSCEEKRRVHGRMIQMPEPVREASILMTE